MDGLSTQVCSVCAPGLVAQDELDGPWRTVRIDYPRTVRMLQERVAEGRMRLLRADCHLDRTLDLLHSDMKYTICHYLLCIQCGRVCFFGLCIRGAPIYKYVSWDELLSYPWELTSLTVDLLPDEPRIANPSTRSDAIDSWDARTGERNEVSRRAVIVTAQRSHDIRTMSSTWSTGLGSHPLLTRKDLAMTRTATPSSAAKILGTALTALLLVVGLSACSNDTPSADPSSEVSTVVALIDVRTPVEFAAGHLAGAMNLDLQSDSFEEQIAQLDPKMAYLVYCQSGNRSAQAVNVMESAGFTEVTDAGSLDAAATATGAEIVSGEE